MMQINCLSTRHVRRLLVTLAAASVLVSPTFAKPVFDLVSLANTGALPQYANSGGESKITPDGRFVVFRSAETQLVTPATSGYQIFLRDRKMGTTELISANDQGQYGVGSSEFPTISDDGCRVAFKSDASNLVANYAYRNSDVYVRDRCVVPMTTTLASLNSSGGQSNAASFTPYLSGNGRYVAFNSYSTDLVPGITGTDLLYLRDLQLQNTILLSANVINGSGEQAWNPAVSRDGSRIAFTARSKNLVAGVVADWNVFLYDANVLAHIRLVTSDANGVPQDVWASGDQPQPGISADGSNVSFYSDSRNLVPNDTNNFAEIFVKNVDTNEIWRASVASDGTQANQDTRFNSTLSQDGTWVTFWALASNLITGTSDLSKLVVIHNIYTGETQRVLGVDPEFYPAISGDLYGRFVSNYWAEKLDARFDMPGLFVYDRHQLPVALARLDASTTLPPQTGNTITLDGSASHNIGNVSSNFFAPKAVPGLVYTWTQIEGNSVTLTDPHAAQPSFTALADGLYRFKLVVSDTVEDSLPSELTLQVGQAAASQVSLDLPAGWSLLGNGYESGFDVASAFGNAADIATVWKWLPNAQPNAAWAFYSPALNAPGLIAYAASKGYMVLSRIEAGEGFWVNANTAHTASISTGTPILSSSFKVSGSHPLGINWSLVATGDSPTPAQFNAALSLTPPATGITPGNVLTMWAWRSADEANVNPAGWYFWAPTLSADGTLQNYLSTRGYLDFATLPGTTPGTLTPSTGFWVNVGQVPTSTNSTPLAHAGPDLIVNMGATVSLDGTTSTDPDGDLLTYKWTAPTGITLSSTTAAKPTFTAPTVSINTSYTLSLKVNDGLVDSLADQIVITVKNNNASPVANAGPDLTVNMGAAVSLDGTTSTDRLYAVLCGT
jgi:hypothetical protein